MHLDNGKRSYRKKIVKRYSESFKLGVLNELSRCESTKAELQARYGLGGETIRNWIKKYKRKDLLNRVVRIETPEEMDEQKQLKKRILELEKALAQTQLDHLKSAAFLSVAVKELGYENRAAFEKKQDAKPSKKQ
jgi:transposase-like protein